MFTERVSYAEMVDHMFFDKAFELYRRRYNDDSKKVMFLLVSDDTNWIKVLVKTG